MENMIYVENLRKEFKKIIKEPGLKGSVKALFKPKKEIITAVDDISFTVPKGEILGFFRTERRGQEHRYQNADGYPHAHLGHLPYQRSESAKGQKELCA